MPDQPREHGDHDRSGGTTPGGKTGAEDLRSGSDRGGEHGDGTVADATRERHAPDPAVAYPSAADPYDANEEPDDEVQDEKPPVSDRPEDWPTYERDQGNPQGTDHGGSVDPANTLTHADSGDQTGSSESG